MCSATGFGGIFKTLMKNNPSLALRDKISVNDPGAKALGYVGLADPVGDMQHKMAGTQSELNQKRRAIGERQANAQRDANYKELVYNTRPAHVKGIAKKQGG